MSCEAQAGIEVWGAERAVDEGEERNYQGREMDISMGLEEGNAGQIN